MLAALRVVGIAVFVLLGFVIGVAYLAGHLIIADVKGLLRKRSDGEA